MGAGDVFRRIQNLFYQEVRFDGQGDLLKHLVDAEFIAYLK